MHPIIPQLVSRVISNSNYLECVIKDLSKDDKIKLKNLVNKYTQLTSERGKLRTKLVYSSIFNYLKEVWFVRKQKEIKNTITKNYSEVLYSVWNKQFNYKT